MQMEGLQGLHGWQWIFIIEALPTILFAFTTYFVLPDFPESKSKCKLPEYYYRLQRGNVYLIHQ